MVRHFSLFKDQLAESGCQKTKENIIPHGKFHLVKNDPYKHSHCVRIDVRTRGFLLKIQGKRKMSTLRG